MIDAYHRATKGKKKKNEVIIFEMDLETNITNILYALKKDTYSLGKYREFKIYELKERIIKSLPFKDRVVHQWYIHEFIKPYFMPRFIKDTYACIEKRGTHEAVRTTLKYMRKMKREYKDYYILKCDIQKFFYNIDRDILFDLLSAHINDKKLLNLTKLLIFDDDNKKGIPIGNYTSQFFANIYLDVLDKYIKEELSVKYYIRYMDDFVLFIKSKEECKKKYKDIEIFLNEKLKLKLNKKSKYYTSKLGCDFCGYIIYETHIKLRKRSIKRYKKAIKYFNFHTDLSTKKNLTLNSFKGHFAHANSYNLINKLCFRV